MSKIGILKNYGGAGSRHEGAGRITLNIDLPLYWKKKISF